MNLLETVTIHFSSGTTASNGAMSPHCRSYMITLRQTTAGRTPLDERGSRLRDLYLEKISLTTDKHPCPPGWIQTRNPRKQAATHTRLRPRGRLESAVTLYI